VHLSAITRRHPAPAANLEAMLDIINQIIGTIRALEGLLGFDLSAMFNKEE
jgi:hypothetical protein